MAEEINYRQPDSQKQRWLKYGSNVAIGSIVVIALAVLVIYLAQSARKRYDTTQAGLYSLKPQTINIVKDLKSQVKLISLYTTIAPEGTNPEDQAKAVQEAQQRSTLVNDLLNEYKRNSSKIDVEAIDPAASPTKVDDLINTVTSKYGGEVQKYKDFIAKYPDTYKKIEEATKAEVAKITKLPMQQLTNQQYAETVVLAVLTVQELPKQLESQKSSIDRRLGQKPPDYKGAVDSISGSMETLSGLVGQVVQNFESGKADEKVPQELRTYMTESLPRYGELKKLADGVVAEIKGLGELKLDTLRQSLRARDSILVLGDTELKVLTSDQVWQNDVDRQATSGTGQQLVKPKFAGEQQITTAILSLTEKPRKIAIVRPGDGPLAESGNPFVRGGPLSGIADRLRAYNFDVVEKDLSGMSAMQAQMQGRPAPEEPTDEELKDAIWLVINAPSQQQNPMMGMSQTIAPKIMEHLNNGGSALILTLPQADKLTEALDDWGVQMMTDQIIVHEPAGESSVRSNDMIEEAKKIPYIFAFNEYGDHLLAKPIRGLDGLMVPIVPVRIQPKPGIAATPLLPIPQSPVAWAESDIQSISQPGKIPKFDEKSGDVGGQQFGGAALERKDKGRLVVIGSFQFATDGLLNLPDENLAQRGVIVARFPANAELITNSIFWLAKMEPMIAISPSAMEVSRIGPISQGTLQFWRVGVLLIGLPALVVIAGIGVFLSRKD